jgi:BA14K-like protein
MIPSAVHEMAISAGPSCSQQEYEGILMRVKLLTVAFVAVGGAAHAEIVTPNHLDCRFNETTGSVVCPAMPSGRSSAEPAAVTAPAPVAVPAIPEPANKGSAEWNAHCAAKYKSFDAATGMYKSFSGKMRPCV